MSKSASRLATSIGIYGPIAIEIQPAGLKSLRRLYGSFETARQCPTSVQALSEMLQGLPKRIRGADAILKRAERSLERNDDAEGIRLLKEFIGLLKDEGAEIHAADQVNALIGVAQQIVACRSTVRDESEDQARRRY